MSKLPTQRSIRVADAGYSTITSKKYYDHILEPDNILIERTEGNKSENAEFIVRACNSHEELLEACKKALTELECAFDEGSIINLVTIENTRKAIAKAEGR